TWRGGRSPQQPGARQYHNERRVYLMKTIHSPACDKLMRQWFGEPHDSVEYRLAGYIFDHTDIEIRDELITIFDEDPPECAAVAAARKLWPLLLLSDPLHEPADLLDELDELARETDSLRMRIEALSAKYRSLEPWSESWNRFPHEKPEFGEHNLFYAGLEFKSAATFAEHVAKELQDAREYAAKIRDYSPELLTPEVKQ
ncbi:hypothetical protein, partial [Micromonospora sp. NPDC048169]|uniref:hypothetical protein n=1 Tax=Micromonospora sp. NPDC048169 TaxID=3154711 RepID=UPI0033F7082B